MARLNKIKKPGVGFGLLTLLFVFVIVVFVGFATAASRSSRKYTASAKDSAQAGQSNSGNTRESTQEEEEEAPDPETRPDPRESRGQEIHALNMVFEASGTYAQEKKIELFYEGKGEPKYYSSNISVLVQDGKVRVQPNFSGKAKITIVVPATDEYPAASTEMVVFVKKPKNEITAEDIVQDYSDKDQEVDLNAKALGRAKLTYESSSHKVTVANGKAMIPADFTGSVEITITAKEAGIYEETTKTINLSVVSGTARKLYETARSQLGISGHGRNNTKYGQYTGANRQAWCASFVSWCAEYAGVRSLKPPAISVVPKSASTLAMCSYSNSYHSWNAEAFEKMKQGDVVFFSRMSRQYEYHGKKVVCHVGIVESSDPVSRKVKVIEGNSTGDRVCRHIYYADRNTGKIGKRYFCGFISIR